MCKHTPEPWHRRIGRKGDGTAFSADEQICNADGRAVIRLLHDGSAEGAANAARIVACVNALAGIETEAIEAGVLVELIEAAKRLKANLDARLEQYALNGELMPVYDGLADLHSALAKLVEKKKIMKTIIQFETADELLSAIARVRRQGDKSPSIPNTAYLVVDGDDRSAALSLSGEGSDGFELSSAITFDTLFEAAMRQAGFSKVHFT